MGSLVKKSVNYRERNARNAKRGSGRRTYNFYGDDARNIEIKALEGDGTVIRALCKDVPRDGARINGMFLYPTKR